ncbi:MAG: hypothetical protein AVDCRST_MAG49-2579 [uncultured Thermomicrobiales bacterium]|uniref:histidine kinase n=1 Tax=uncultured Thermomicrobiales bacterium TaxID=1645740 RepID=A0A6J4UWQ3_9BACT|nr:MAG: hypothetical protein AVDCRST_MAG49-2579 [uncultured Thermomicrobiales bacterium]
MPSLSVTVARPPSARLVAVGAVVLALLSGVSGGLWEARTTGEIGARIAIWTLLDLAGALAFVLVVAFVGRVVTPAVLTVSPRVLGPAVSYGTYAAGGVAGGFVRRLVGSVPALRPAEPWPWNYYADVWSLVAAAVVLGFVANQYTAFLERLHAHERTLTEQVGQLRQSRQQITAAEERLRREIAELLHGRVQTRLLVIWYRLGECERLLAVDPARASAVLAEARAQIDEIREQDVREASHLLHPSIIRVGLGPAIRSLASQPAGDLAVTVEVAPELAALDDPAENRIPEGVRLVAYRVVEEALNNAYRHAAAGTVAVRLDLDPRGQLRVTVADDGRGFDTARLQEGLGLGSISAWVGQIDGGGRLTSSPGRGTTLEVVLPLPVAPTSQPPGVPSASPRAAFRVEPTQICPAAAGLASE